MCERIIDGNTNPEVNLFNIYGALSDPNVHTITLRGRFNFGSTLPLLPLENRKTVTILRGVKIQGDPDVGAEIIGGGADADFLIGWGKGACGPFNVRNFGSVPPPGFQAGDDKPVIFENIQFSEWKGEAILVEACQGLEVRGCKFTKPFATTMLNPTAPGVDFTFEYNGGTYPLRFIHAVLALGPYCRKTFIAEDNYCSLKEYASRRIWDPISHRFRSVPEPLAHDDQFLACVLSNFDVIKVRNNDITTHDDGIEIILNGNSNMGIDAEIGSAIHVHQNHVAVIGIGTWSTPQDREGSRWWSGHAAIVCCANQNEKTEITDNIITVEGGGSIDGDPPNSTALCLSSPPQPLMQPDMKAFVVRNNSLHLTADPAADPSDWRSYPACGIMLGANKKPTRFPQELGASLNYALISANWLAGAASFGIITFDANEHASPPPAPPVTPNTSNNDWIINNDLSSFTPLGDPIGAWLLFSSQTHDIMYCENETAPPGSPPIDMGTGNSTEVSQSFLFSLAEAA